MSLSLGVGWALFISVSILGFIAVASLPRGDELPVWMQIFGGVLIGAVFMNFAYAYMYVRRQFLWAWYLLIVLTFIIPLIFILYRFIQNVRKVDLVIVDY